MPVPDRGSNHAYSGPRAALSEHRDDQRFLDLPVFFELDIGYQALFQFYVGKIEYSRRTSQSVIKERFDTKTSLQLILTIALYVASILL
jgi:hypothetical protein